MNHVSYHSEQVHTVVENGRGVTRRNVVDIRNGKGTKAVEEYSVDGKKVYSKEKALTKSELECIQRNKFVPGLFKDCIKPLRSRRKTLRRKSK